MLCFVFFFQGSVDTLPEEELDVEKINSYLKEASGALLADCGYKAVQIFRGPLRYFIESSKVSYEFVVRRTFNVLEVNNFLKLLSSFRHSRNAILCASSTPTE